MKELDGELIYSIHEFINATNGVNAHPESVICNRVYFEEYHFFKQAYPEFVGNLSAPELYKKCQEYLQK